MKEGNDNREHAGGSQGPDHPASVRQGPNHPRRRPLGGKRNSPR
jgi:hypothetical protein